MPSDEQPVVVSRSSEFEITTRRTGDFLVVRVAGRYSEEMLPQLRERVFPDQTNFAVDASDLKGYATPFAREILAQAQNVRKDGARLVLLRPPDSLKDLLNLLEPNHMIGFRRSEEEMSPPTAPLAKGFLEHIKRAVTEDLHWQVMDREGCWICPYCAKLQESVKLPDEEEIPQPVLDAIYRHLYQRCADYMPAKTEYRSLRELVAARREANRGKIALPKKEMRSMQTQITYLQGQLKKTSDLRESAEVASHRQRSMMPARPPKMPGAEAGILYRPAAQVSGDFYDFLTLEDGKIAFVIGDVSGHGIEAGILMGVSKKLLHVRLMELNDPIAAICKTNEDLIDDLRGGSAFVTAIVAVYDPKEETLTTVRAGHNPAILFNPDRDPQVTQVESGGLGIGLTAGEKFQSLLKLDRREIFSGDILLLYTDGIVEAQNDSEEEYGLDRIIDFLKSKRGDAAPFLIQGLSHDLDRFVRGLPQEDDVTAVCIRFEQGNS